jgi:hypothetical protein
MPLILTNGTTVNVIQPVAANVTVQRPNAVTLGLVAVPAGAALGSEAYEYIQSGAASTWIIALPGTFPARRPGVTLYDSTNNEIESDVIWTPSTHTITVTFPSPVSGYAVIT